MTVFVDADACPVLPQIAEISRRFSRSLFIFCDLNHQISTPFGTVIPVDSGPDAADYAILSRCKAGDLVITQDYGLASLVLSRRAFALHPSGWFFSSDNIDTLLMDRYLSAKQRKASGRYGKGPKKRTNADNTAFVQALTDFLQATV